MQQDPFIGRQLGAYRVQSKLGEGGMASVYKAYHDRLKRDVAIKIIAPQIADQADFKARFEREAQVIASLEHRNIVAVYDFGELNDLTYLVMQYVGGGTLRDKLKHGRPLESHQAARYALQMAQALHRAHQRGIVHRDVKPQNMLVSGNDPDHLLLSDFGIAKLFDSSHETIWSTNTQSNRPVNPSLTSVDQIIGTAEYMAPEQITGQHIDARTDVYALGVVLYQMLTGRPPFDAPTATALMYQHVYAQPRPVQEINPAVHPMLAQITTTALQKAPEARFQSADAMARALEMALSTIAGTSGATTFSTSQPYATLPATGTSSPMSFSQAQAASSGAFIGTGADTDRTMLSNASQRQQGYQPNTTAGYSMPALPQKKRSKTLFRVQSIATSIIIIVALIVLGMKIIPGLLPQSTSTNTVQTFTDRFTDNHYNWFVGSGSGLSAQIDSNGYTLTTDNQQRSYYPYPTSAGQLPDNFTLNATMQQVSGATSQTYGIVFRASYNNSVAQDGYACIINSNGNYALEKITASGFNLLQEGQSPAIHQSLHQWNTIEVAINNHNLTCKVNNQSLDLGQNTSITSTGGQLGLLVTGPSSTFQVKQVQLTTAS